MRGLTFTSAAIAAVTFASSALADVDPIVIKGSKFFYKTNGTQFFIRGVAYQQDVTSSDSSASSYVDPLANATACKRDIPYLQKLQTNTIRVYAIDPTNDHSDCMNMLADAGIYVVSDLSSPDESINRNDPTWDVTLYSRYTSVVDALANYTNTLGFFAGNEVSNQANNTAASAFVKAAVRDTKSYISSAGYRALGVGYATNDDADIRVNLADYFNCGDSDSSIDFWGYNIYSWCGDSSYTESGYDTRTEEFEDYNVPVFFAEYGCNSVSPRPFTEVTALFGSTMDKVWSGGIVYMYYEEANDYGLVSLDGNTISTLKDFSNLSKKIASITPTGTNSASYTPSNTAAQSCPSTGTAWQAATALPPTPNEQLCGCMMKTLSCVAKSTLSDTKISTLFGTVCGLDSSACSGVSANGTTGVYGAYSMCNSTQMLSHAFNVYYKAQSSASDACDFDGAASTQSAATATGECKSLIAEAGTAGTGTVTSQPTGTGDVSGSGSSSTGSAASGSGGMAVGAPSLNFGALQLGAYILVAVVSGAGMLFL
ncbi:MAG: 1,3-beta-glucanosyltransferase gas1 [Cirrosporium novae-zelandiae]|nr:MAG: 1,3-beta-glucanosyltransferase gas1 [Cirrosporium novae-zelandiae]